MLSPSLLLLVIAVYANEDEGVHNKGPIIMISSDGEEKRADVIPFSGGMYGKRSDHNEHPLYAGWYEKRTVMPYSGGIYGKRDSLPYSGGLHGKHTAMPFSGGFYGKRAVVMPFSGGMYGKRASMPVEEDSYDKRSERNIRSPMPISGGFFG
ncbi:hypothetical protein KIN20_034141 [Parelaphostrongylus tenuis]|uniref:Uncharacterized protein n=1 Tax=Parelaphostrongylus tenuis TaxID=148309 RepID=A0AAD5WJH8_PARTN|nr:hypothetical protein KIN20_034141 [Parelaphostrongylus tenuis]